MASAQAAPAAIQPAVLSSSDREALAQRVVRGIGVVAVKLSALEDDIRALWTEFAVLPKGETIHGCTTKAEFCEKVLHKTPRAVRYLLNGGSNQNYVPVAERGNISPAFLPFEYEEHFLTPEELSEFENECKTLPFTRRKNPRNPSTFIRNMGFLYCDQPGTHAEKDGNLVRRSIASAPQIIRTILDKLSERTGRNVNYCSLMCYEGGTDHIGWHQHSEDRGHDTPVMIVPCGQERTFSFRSHGTNEKNGVVLKSGSLTILPSSFNDTHDHAVLDDKTVTGTRWAINAKCMDDIYHGAGAPAVTYTVPAPVPAARDTFIEDPETEALIANAQANPPTILKNGMLVQWNGAVYELGRTAHLILADQVKEAA